MPPFSRHLRLQLQRVLPSMPVRKHRGERRQNHCHAEANDRRHQPGIPFGADATTERFNGSLRQAFSLQGVVKLCFELRLGLSLPKLRPDLSCKFHRLKGKGDDVISAQVQRAGPLQSIPMNDHHNLE
jgi:hypothetical protein